MDDLDKRFKEAKDARPSAYEYKGHAQIPISNLLNKLDKVKRIGIGKWMACCPSHDDKSPSLGIKLAEDNKILIHCYAGCGVLDVLGAIGVDIAELMPDKMGEKVKNEYVSRTAKALKFESRLIALAAIQANHGYKQTDDEVARLQLAIERVTTLSREL